MDGIAGLQLTASEHRIGVQREIGDREGANAVKYPGCETFHSPGFRSAIPEKPALAWDGCLGQNLRPAFRTGTLTSASLAASSS
jgi:hypothetical protein